MNIFQQESWLRYLKSTTSKTIDKANRTDRARLKTEPIAKAHSLELRDKATKAEMFLKSYIVKSGIIFTFQKVIIKGGKFYIVDFWINDVVVEVDGSGHYTEEGRKKDKKRTEWLKTQGIKHVIRFSNNQVLKYPNECIEHIKLWV